MWGWWLLLLGLDGLLDGLLRRYSGETRCIRRHAVRVAREARGRWRDVLLLLLLLLRQNVLLLLLLGRGVLVRVALVRVAVVLRRGLGLVVAVRGRTARVCFLGWAVWCVLLSSLLLVLLLRCTIGLVRWVWVLVGGIATAATTAVVVLVRHVGGVVQCSIDFKLGCGLRLVCKVGQVSQYSVMGERYDASL